MDTPTHRPIAPDTPFLLYTPTPGGIAWAFLQEEGDFIKSAYHAHPAALRMGMIGGSKRGTLRTLFDK